MDDKLLLLVRGPANSSMRDSLVGEVRKAVAHLRMPVDIRIEDCECEDVELLINDKPVELSNKPDAARIVTLMTNAALETEGG